MADAFMRRSAPAHICDTNSAGLLHLSQTRDLRGAALHGIELAEYLACLARNRIGNGGDHAPALLRSGVLWAAEPARRRDRADVGEHRLKAPGAAQAIHLVTVRRVGSSIRSRCTSSGRSASTASASISAPWVRPLQLLREVSSAT